MTEIVALDTTVKRGGIVLEPNGEPAECEGVLNPASVRTRDGRLLMYPRMVASGNRSRIGICEQRVDASGAMTFERLGYALEPYAPYEIRNTAGGYGCEDPRVTFVPVLDRFVMCYTAYGPDGPRIAIALSNDGYAWERLGLMDFAAAGLPHGDDKDGAFFPEPVISPAGVESLAFYHRPMLHISTVDGHGAIPMILHLPPQERESTRIGYVPLAPVLRNINELLRVSESALVLAPSSWDRIKTGAGTPPILVEEGWLSIYHGVDPVFHENEKTTLCYSAGIVVHDRECPHIVRYRSPQPVLTPETAGERSGIVNNVVFPTGIDRLGPDARSSDVYYGMADARIGVARFSFGPATFAASAESAA
jgi:predicted GH43/DUF377 family glycosyl hydrolase